MDPSDRNRLDLERLDELRGLGLSDDGTSYLDRAIDNFLQGVGDEVTAMQRAARCGDTARLQTVAHKLAGAALNLGVTGLGEGLRRVEEHLMSDRPDDATTLLAVLLERLTGDLDALRAYQREELPVRAS